MRVGEYIVRICDGLKYIEMSARMNPDMEKRVPNLKFLGSGFPLLCRGMNVPIGVRPGAKVSETPTMTRKMTNFKDSFLYACLMSSVEASFEILRTL